MQLGDVTLSGLKIGEICPVSLVSGSGDALKRTQDKTDDLASNSKVRKWDMHGQEGPFYYFYAILI